jgi:ribonuclease G
MTRYLLWDAAPGEVRTGLVENGKLVELRLIRMADACLPDIAGAVRSVRLGSKISANRALVHIDGVEGEVSPIPALSEGGFFDAELVRTAIPEPGRWKRAQYRPSQKSSSEASIFPTGLTSIICTGPIEADQLYGLFGDQCPSVEIDAEAIEDAQLDLWCERAIIGEFVIDGGLLSVERTRAMTMIDIDGIKDTRSVNLAAARTIPWLLRFLGIGGQVGIDFLATANKAERAEIDQEFSKAAAGLESHERTAMNGFGFVQIVLPRPGSNVIEQLCGTNLKLASDETKALLLLRAASRSIGHGKRRLAAPPAIIDRLNSWPAQLAALRSSLGAEIELVSDSSVIGYGHVHVSQ